MSTLKKIQQETLRMLVMFDQYCNDNGLRYFMVGGTLLGAVRHKGFIPWDDDIDLVMPRSDYERLLALSPRIDGAELKSFENDSEYRLPYMKLFSTRTTLVEQDPWFYLGGLFLDIFPLDAVPSDVNAHLGRLKKLQRQWAWHVRILPAGKRLPIALFYRYFFRTASLLRRFDAYCRSAGASDSEQVMNSYGVYGAREVSRRANFAGHVMLEFENHMFRAPIGYDEYLHGVYGDYMKLPPEEKRVSNHGFRFIDLDRRLDKAEVLSRLEL